MEQSFVWPPGGRSYKSVTSRENYKLVELNWFYLIVFLNLTADSYSTEFITYLSIKVIKMNKFLSYFITIF